MPKPDRYIVSADVLDCQELQDKLNAKSALGLNVISVATFDIGKLPKMQCVIVLENIYG